MSDKMTIAQALRRIKKLKGQIAEHYQRAVAGVSYDITKEPAFRFVDEMNAMIDLQTEMISLETRVAVANATNFIVDGKHEVILAMVIRILQELKGRIVFYKGLNLRNETVKTREQEWDDNELKHLTRVSETTYKSDLTEQDRDSRVKNLQNEFERLNNLVEDANHMVLV